MSSGYLIQPSPGSGRPAMAFWRHAPRRPLSLGMPMFLRHRVTASCPILLLAELLGEVAQQHARRVVSRRC
jgi:hypothetical protein